jgi:hypothetical protein
MLKDIPCASLADEFAAKIIQRQFVLMAESLAFSSGGETKRAGG